jgi:hypothetical protein
MYATDEDKENKSKLKMMPSERRAHIDETI